MFFSRIRGGLPFAEKRSFRQPSGAMREGQFRIAAVEVMGRHTQAAGGLGDTKQFVGRLGMRPVVREGPWPRNPLEGYPQAELELPVA